MKPLSVAVLLLMGGVCAAFAACAIALLIAMGGGPFLLSPFLPLTFLLLAGLTLWAGIHVKRLRAHQVTWMTPMGALKVAMMARASSVVGAVFAGALLGVAGVALTRMEAEAMVAMACVAAISAAAASLWCVVAGLVERWCVVDPHDDEEGQGIEGRGTRPLSPRA